MIVYYMFFALSFINYKIFRASDSENNKRIYNVIMGIIVFFLFVFRDTSLGMNDVEESYVPMFENLKYIDLKDVFYISQNDYLFYFSSKVISLIFPNTRFWIALMSLPICLALEKVINSYSKIDWISWIVFFCLGYFNYNVTLMKQSVAIAFGIFSFLAIIENKNYKRAIVFSLIAMGFHTTGIITALPIVLNFFKPKMNIKKGSIIVGISFIVWNISGQVVDFLFEKITIYRFQRYYRFIQGFNMTMLLIYIMIFVFCMVSTCMIGKKDNDSVADDYMLLMLALSLPILGLTSVFSTLFRVALYGNIYSIICIPNSIIKIEKKEYHVGATIVILIFLIYYANIRGLLEVAPYKSWLL